MKKSYTGFLFAGIITILLVISYVTYKNYSNYTREVALIRHSNEIIKTTEFIFSMLKDAETGQRGFQLTGDTSYLRPYYSALKVLPHQFKTLDSLVKNSPQQSSADSLKSLAQAQFLVVANIIANVERSGLYMDRFENTLMARGKKNMDLIRRTAARILSEEEKVFKKRVDTESNYRKLTPMTLMTYASLALLALVFMFLRILHELRKSQATERLLHENVEHQKVQIGLMEERKIFLNEAETVAQMGSWKWIVKTDQMIWSDGLYKIYNKKPGEFLTFDSFQDATFPEDRSMVSNFLSDVKTRKKPSRIDYRIIRDDQLRYVSVTAKPGRLEPIMAEVIIGAVIDITESKAYEKQLQQYVAELKRSNEDLEQFAYVASHDLQEPLRKIRAFGDRLTARFSKRLEAQGIDYVTRMQSAAARMQLLIEDLLSFSRVSRAESYFERLSTRAVLQEVLDDLDQLITREKANIRIGDLPEFYGDKSQIKRLFQNIIGNAVKFHKAREKPVVDVSSKFLEKSEAEKEAGSPLANHQFIRFSIKDNGIGFDEKYAEKIFNIFQRLNGRASYQGTGIGLAICRKIVSNHRGFIMAKSIEDVGSEFIIILPKDPTPIP